VFVLGSQEGSRHCVFWPGTVQVAVTMPSHLPSQPVPSPTHAGREPTGLPLTAEQVPSLPLRLHASHWPRQSLLQQMPSAQTVDWHWLPALHDVPRPPFGMQRPPLAQ